MAVVLLYGPRMFNQDGDLGRHITIGRYILDTRSIPLNDIFSHTMTGEPLVPHEWLAQVLFALAYRLLGLDGDVLLAAVVIALSFLLTYRETVRRGASRLVGMLAVLLAAAASSLHWLARPHIFTFLLLALWAYRLETFREGQTRRLWVFPLMMAVWANTHGAFIAGFVVLGIYFLEWAWEFLHKRAPETTGLQLGVIAADLPAGHHVQPGGLAVVGHQPGLHRQPLPRQPHGGVPAAGLPQPGHLAVPAAAGAGTLCAGRGQGPAPAPRDAARPLGGDGPL